MDELGEFEAFLNVPVRRVQRPLRDRLNPLTAYDEIDFFDRYRMDKSAFQELSTLARMPSKEVVTDCPG